MISVIVPVLNEPNLQRVVDHVHATARTHVEVVIVDASQNIARLKRATCIRSTRGRGQQMNAGAQRTSGDVLFFLHCDATLPLHWDQAILSAVKHHDAGWFTKNFHSLHPALLWNQTFTNFRARLGAPLGDNGLFMTRACFDDLGGFPNQVLFEDVEMAKKLKGKKTIMLREAIGVSTRKFKKHGVFRTIGLLLRMRFKYRMGSTPEQLYEEYYR